MSTSACNTVAGVSARPKQPQLESARPRDRAYRTTPAKSAYDMAPDEFERETERIWAQVKPLYDDLHCYVRAGLQKKYGKALVPDGKPIPAHLLGNMWAQEWTNVYPLVEPYPGVSSLDVTKTLRAQKWTAVRMVKLGESFYTGLGLDLSLIHI